MKTKTLTLTSLALLDAALLTSACLIPAASHMLALPLYMLNPMLALLLVALLVGRDSRNALLMAVLLPAVSCLLTGMPTALKMVCMIAELATVASMFDWLQKRWAVLPAVLTAILAGKIVYYGMKTIVIAPDVLISTNWVVQVLTIMLWGGLFALIYKKVK